MVRSQQATLSRQRTGADERFHHGDGAKARESLETFYRRSEAERRLHVPHLSRRALREGQTSVQGACRLPFPPRTRQGRACARFLHALLAKRGILWRRIVDAATRCSDKDPRGYCGETRGVEATARE